MSLDDNSSMRFQVYYYLVGLAGRTHQLHTVYKDMATTKTMFSKAPPTSDQVQKLYRLLHEVKEFWDHFYSNFDRSHIFTEPAILKVPLKSNFIRSGFKV